MCTVSITAGRRRAGIPRLHLCRAAWAWMQDLREFVFSRSRCAAARSGTESFTRAELSGRGGSGRGRGAVAQDIAKKVNPAAQVAREDAVGM